MPQPVLNPNGRFQGPFRGLATDIDPQQLGPQYARKAHNVLLNRGRIRPRTPWREARGEAIPTTLVGPDAFGGRSILAVHHFQPDPTSNVSHVLFMVRGGLWVIQSGPAINITNPNPQQLASGVFDKGCQFLQVGKWVYVLSPSDPIWKTDGTKVFKAGMEPPATVDFTHTLLTTGEGVNAPTVQYYISLASQDLTVESNRVFVAEQGALSDLSGIRVVFTRALPRFTGDQAYWLNLYRRNITREQIGARLVASTPIGTGQTDVLFTGTEASITLSVENQGPFAPVRNGQPPREASCGDIYDERLWINDPTRKSAVRFSALTKDGIQQFEHFADEDYLTLVGEESDHIGGIREYGGALYAGKARGVWQIGGHVETPTNLSIAVAAGALDSTALVTRTRSEVGPSNVAGNGFVVAGSPARLFFGNLQGFWSFDGVDARRTTDAISSLWQEFSAQEPYSPSFSYGCDALEGVLYIAMVVGGEGYPDESIRPATFAMVYDLTLGGFVTCGGRDYASLLGSVHLDPICFANAISKSGQSFAATIKRDRPVVLGTSGGAILFVDPNDASDIVVSGWEYESVDLNVADGLEAHVYHVKLLLGGISPPPNPLDPVGIGDPAQTIMGVSVRRFSSESDVNDKLIEIGGRKSFLVPVGRKLDQMILRLHAEPNVGYRREVGVTGWELDLELQGQW